MTSAFLRRFRHRGVDLNTRAVVALAVIVLVSQAIGVAEPEARPWILAASVPLLDLLGAFYSAKAARRSGQLSWWLTAAARGASVLTTLLLFGHVITGNELWWWAGTCCRLVMFVLLATAVILPVGQLRGGHRRALVADLCTVLAGGFMPFWYFMLGPVMTTEAPNRLWMASVGYPLGDLLLLVAVGAVVLRKKTSRLRDTDAVLTGGLALYIVADATWSSININGESAENSPVACVSMTLACLLLTIAPMLAIAGATHSSADVELRAAAGWPVHLPMLALGAGGMLMLAVSVRDDSFFPWGGLVLASLAMKIAIAARQHVFVRDSRDRLTSDPLTGLANRSGLDEAIQRASRREEATAMLLIDLDGFKQVNDVYGHAAGDTMLIQFGRQLRSSVRRGDVAARIGGDEFAVLLTHVTAPDQAIAVAARILAAMAEDPVYVDGDTFCIRASIGIALGSAEQTSRETMRRADLSMYEAKRAGTHSFMVYDPSMADRRVDDAVLSDELADAMDTDQIRVLYQPIVGLGDGRPLAAEALVRWEHPTRGTISPGQFIPVAERNGLIDALGSHVLESACRQLQRWRLERPETCPEYVSVNLSPRQLSHPTLVRDVMATLQRNGIEASSIVLEITESAIVDPDVGIPVLQALHSHGVRIAIDDFGTGYSSLHYLTRLPVDIVKIDRAFVAELNGTPAGAAIAEAVLRLSEVLHFTTVAEGVETREQIEELTAMGCTVGQGYAFAPPLSGEHVMSWFDRHAHAEKAS